MEDTLALVLEDTGALAELCGANDQNLREMERLLGGRLHCRGNEFSLSGADPAQAGLFTRLVDELLKQLALGSSASPELIQAVYHALGGATEDGPAAEALGDFRQAFIQIPGGNGRIFPKGQAQARYVLGMMSKELCLAVGPAGTGKTYLAVAYALREVLSKNYRKLILTRPVVEAGESLGFLPGDLVQKINPYLRPLYDAMDSLVPYECVRRLEENRQIEVAPLAYMRGRSLNDCVIILDEAQNTTNEQMKMFLTRLGHHSKAVVTGDVTQVDLPRRAESGLIQALEVLEGIDDIAIHRLEGRDIVRNPLIRKIIRAYDEKKR